MMEKYFKNKFPAELNVFFTFYDLFFKCCDDNDLQKFLLIDNIFPF